MTETRKPPRHHDVQRLTCDNGRSKAEPRVNGTRPLTHPLDQTEEGLAMKATQCSAEGCSDRIHAKGYCQVHYRRVKTTGSTETTRITYDGCTVEDCENVHASRGLCATHLSRQKRTGTIARRVPARERVWDFITKSTDDQCWLWQGNINNAGYGRIGHEYAHRIVCELTYGPPADDQEVLHSCDNPPCCNPAHLRWGTHTENIRESFERGRR